MVETVVMPTRLYKYLPVQFADGFRRRGDLLFRNLAHFRKIEEKGRGDLLEGLHMDRPDNPITLTREDGRTFSYEGAAMLNAIATERLFVFCLSTALRSSLFGEFNCDTCIEILDPGEFLRRCGQKMARQARWQEPGLLHGPVEYYAPNRPVLGDVKNPRCIPFFKHKSYGHQNEYRLAASLTRGFRMKTSIILTGHDLEAEARQRVSDHRVIRVGSLDDITLVHRSVDGAA
jgi:hypothetical protein